MLFSMAAGHWIVSLWEDPKNFGMWNVGSTHKRMSYHGVASFFEVVEAGFAVSQLPEWRPGQQGSASERPECMIK